MRGSYGAPLPGPGVYARHNAVDTPALLPDGTPAEISLSRGARRPRRRPAIPRSGDELDAPATADDDA